MKVSGSATLRAPRAEVWSALQDPAVLVATIPGCQQLEATGDDSYRMTVSAGVASIKGTYIGDVRLTAQDPPNAYTLIASGQGAPGTVQAEARVQLADGDAGVTLLSYDADAVVGGMIGGVGQRVLAGVAKKTAGEFFRAVDSFLTSGALPAGLPAEPPAGAAAVGPGAPAAVYRAAPGAPAGSANHSFARGALLGAGIALAGVLIGLLAGRRR